MYAFTLERPANLADATRLAAAGAKPAAKPTPGKAG
jgi:CO/xanthine dehydrogenase FAD-binding subunit